jgi:hypothetical protein
MFGKFYILENVTDFCHVCQILETFDSITRNRSQRRKNQFLLMLAQRCIKQRKVVVCLPDI